MKLLSALALLLLSGFLLFGCTGYSQGAATQQPTVQVATSAPPTSGDAMSNYKVVLLDYPSRAEAGKPFTVKWVVFHNKYVLLGHTAVHYGPESKTGDLTPSTYPLLTAVQKGPTPTPCAVTNCAAEVLESQFSDSIVPSDAGKIYLRAHAIIDGKHYWTPEVVVDTSGAASPTLTPSFIPDDTVAPSDAMAKVQEFSMEAKQWELTPSSITVKKGVSVKLTIKSIDVDHGFALPDFGVSRTLKPGVTEVIEFTPDKTGTFTFFCNVFCGTGHKDMKGSLTVTE